MPLEPFEPDALELRIAASTYLPPCPFCEHSAIMSSSVNRSPAFGREPVYQARIACTNHECNASVVANERTRDEAQQRAIAHWTRRAPVPLAPAPASAAQLRAGDPHMGGIYAGSHSEIEDALDKADAPIKDGDRWLTFPERVAALAARADDLAWLAERERWAGVHIDFERSGHYRQHRVTWHQVDGWCEADGQSLGEAIAAARAKAAQ